MTIIGIYEIMNGEIRRVQQISSFSVFLGEILFGVYRRINILHVINVILGHRHFVPHCQITYAIGNFSVIETMLSVLLFMVFGHKNFELILFEINRATVEMNSKFLNRLLNDFTV